MNQTASLSLGSASDLVIAAPWKNGIIPAGEATSPRTRLAITFRTLFNLRKSARERAGVPLFADPVEQLEQIHSFRFAAEADGLRLSVSFDNGWETYMDALQHRAGPFLDLLCCHCRDYPLAREASPSVWCRWVRDHQRPSDYFFSATSLTVGDLGALQQSEALQRSEPKRAHGDLALARFYSASPLEIAARNRAAAPAEALDQAMLAIATMFTLTRYWSADIVHSTLPQDALTLLRATRGLINDEYLTPGSAGSFEKPCADELNWYRQPIPVAAAGTAPGQIDRANVQKGILTSFDTSGPVTHGALFFLTITDPKKARKTLATMKLSTEAGESPADGIFRNVALTAGGIARLGLPQTLLERLPTAFLDGPEARAGLVGDISAHHPSTWSDLRRGFGDGADAMVPRALVDVVIQLRTSAKGAPRGIEAAEHPLHKELAEWRDQKAGSEASGLALVAVQPLAVADPRDTTKNHLGFTDGISQPQLDALETSPWSDRAPPSTFVLGYDGEATDPFLRDGSFLAMRRLTIDRTKWDAVLNAGRSCCLIPAALAESIVGRRADGSPLVSATLNNFTFEADPHGDQCPRQSHVRRANPRTGTVPRIVRRGMSFGPATGTGTGTDPGGGERGTLFMAYCADLATQYEVILRWLNGGNSTRLGSFLADPLTGVPQPGKRTYRFPSSGRSHRLALPAEADAFMALSWSMYLFAPSLCALKSLKAEILVEAPATAVDAATGTAIIAGLKAAGAGEAEWAAALTETGAEMSGAARAVWAAIRAGGGVYDSPAGYLVGGYDQVMEVLRDDGSRFSVESPGWADRIKMSLGSFHLGMDPRSAAYKKEAPTANKALLKVTRQDAFDSARAAMAARVKGLVASGPRLCDLIRDVFEPALSATFQPWFGIPDGICVVEGAEDWSGTGCPEAHFPGDFWSSSRHAFAPFATRETARLSALHGPHIVDRIEPLVQAYRASLGPAASIFAAIAKDTASYPTAHDAARVIAGCMIGGVPTIIGNAAEVFVQGLADGELLRAQFRWLRLGKDRDFAAAGDHLAALIDCILQTSPLPELLWRVVAFDGDWLGGVRLTRSRKVIFSLASAARERGERGMPDDYIAFGTDSDLRGRHGCPGREMAIGTMLGFIAGFIESTNFRSPATAMVELRPLREKPRRSASRSPCPFA